MTIVRHWAGGFSLLYAAELPLLITTIRFEKIKLKCDAKNEKNLSSGSSEMFKTKKMLFGI